MFVDGSKLMPFLVDLATESSHLLQYSRSGGSKTSISSSMLSIANSPIPKSNFFFLSVSVKNPSVTSCIWPVIGELVGEDAMAARIMYLMYDVIIDRCLSKIHS